VLTYSASAVDVATVLCFFEFQQIGEFPISIIYPEVDFLSLRSPAKSASVYACIFPLPSYLILKFLVLFKYFNILRILFQSETVGFSQYLVALWVANAISGRVFLDIYINEPMALLYVVGSNGSLLLDNLLSPVHGVFAF